jgi:hypothetical protein
MLKQFAHELSAAIVLASFVTMMSVWMMVIGG